MDSLNLVFCLGGFVLMCIKIYASLNVTGHLKNVLIQIKVHMHTNVHVIRLASHYFNINTV